MPVNATARGLSLALSVKVNVPLRAPTPPGVKVTETEHEPDGATSAPVQVSALLAKSELWVPPSATLLTVSVAVPLFITVTVCAALIMFTGSFPKLTLEPDSVTAGAVPVPVRATVCVLLDAPLSLSVMVSMAVRVPVAVGVKITSMRHEPPAATDVPQVFVSAKFPALVPLSVMVATESNAVPVFDSVTDIVELGVPTSCPPNDRLEPERLATGAMPVPVSATACGLSLALSVMVSVPVRAPVVAGMKAMLIVQFDPEDREKPQKLVWLKSPLTAMLLMVTGPIPVLVRLTT